MLILLIDKNIPFIKPCFFKESIEYVEHVGVYLQFDPIKEDIGGIETFLPALSSGQWLSLPFILIGIIMLYISNRKTI